MEKLKIIAEVANAHQGNIETLRSLVNAAKDAGADGVKFQLFKYDHLATPDFEWYQVYVDLFIPDDRWKAVFQEAKALGLEVWADVFDDWGLDLSFTATEFIDGLKLPPTVLQHSQIAQGILSQDKPVMVGVGGWLDSEIDEFLASVAEAMQPRLTLMHGFQGYPTDPADATLARIAHLKERYRIPVGFADHEDGDSSLAIELPIYAYFAGAEVVEKHLTLNRSAKGYDYFSSLMPDEFKAMATRLRQAEVVMGSAEVTPNQRQYLKSAVRVVAAREIGKGEIVTADKVAFKRSPLATALMPLEFEQALPAIVTCDLKENVAIESSNLKKPVVVAVIICRLKSTRLPGKALLPIYGIPSVERCLINALAIPGVDHVVLATSHLHEDDPLEACTLNGKIQIIRGNPDNVALRMMAAVSQVNADIALRITGDCPAVSPEIVGYLIEHHLQTGADMTIPTASHPIGTAGDVYTVAALQRLLNVPQTLTHTEYLSFYFRNNPSMFRVNMVELPLEWRHPEWRLTLDEPQDLKMFEMLYAGLDVGQRALPFTELASFLQSNDEVAFINADVALKWRDNQGFLREMMDATRLGLHEIS